MREFILVNCILKPNVAMDEFWEVTEIRQVIIPVSMIARIGSLNMKISKANMTEEIKNKVQGMSLEDDLGGSLISYLDEFKRIAYMQVLETPEAIYRRIYPE